MVVICNCPEICCYDSEPGLLRPLSLLVVLRWKQVGAWKRVCYWQEIERFSYDLEMKTRELNRSKKQTEIERFDWLIKRIQMHVTFGWLSERSGENLHTQGLSRNQSILRFDVILQHDWPIEQCLLHIRVFFGEKAKSPCFDLFIHWLIKQITNTHRNYFSRSYENRSIRYKFVVAAEFFFSFPPFST